MAINFQDIFKQFGSPLYIYDLDSIIANIEQLKSSLTDVELYYAVKANPNLILLKELKAHVCGLDISSGGEIEQALLAGYHAENFSFAGPGKTEQALKIAIKNNTGSINAESLDDLTRIIKIAKQLQQPANISLRINPLKLINKFAIKMGGKATQFGIDEENIETAINLVKENPQSLNFVGYHIYAGTQCLDAASFKENFEYIFELLAIVTKKYQLTPKKINVGGGFGIPYFAGNQNLDIAAAIKHLNNAVKEFKANNNLAQTAIILELGRYLVGPYGYYLTQVLARKESREKIYIIVDGGMHQHLSASGNLGQVIRKNYQIKNITSQKKETEKIDIAGALCTPLDILATNIELPQTNVDDLIVIENSGAYGYSSSPLLFLGHPTPREILVKNNKSQIIRESKSMIDFN